MSKLVLCSLEGSDQLLINITEAQLCRVFTSSQYFSKGMSCAWLYGCLSDKSAHSTTSTDLIAVFTSDGFAADKYYHSQPDTRCWSPSQANGEDNGIKQLHYWLLSGNRSLPVQHVLTQQSCSLHITHRSCCGVQKSQEIILILAHAWDLHHHPHSVCPATD